MEKAGFTHGREARVNLHGLNVRPTREGENVIYFCDVGPIDVVEVMQEGDGHLLPEEVEVEDLYFSGLGSYSLQGAILSSNGVLKVKADEQTHIEWQSPLRWVRDAWRAISALFTGGR